MMKLFVSLLPLFAFLLLLLPHQVTSTCHSYKENDVEDHHVVEFIVALDLPQKAEIHHKLLDVSNPKSKNYGQYMSLEQIREKFGPPTHVTNLVSSYFQNIHMSTVTLSESGDMLKVAAPVSSIESTFETNIVMHDCYGEEDTASPTTVDNNHKSKNDKTNTKASLPLLKSSIRASKALVIPEHINKYISFISLDIPTSYIAKKGHTYLQELEKSMSPQIEESSLSSTSSDYTFPVPLFYNASVTTGSQEALIRFNILCGDGSWNQMNPPCADLEPKYQPTFFAKVTLHVENKANPFLLSTEPLRFHLDEYSIYCFNIVNGVACSGIDGRNCTCITKLAPLPKYTQLRASLYAQSSSYTQNKVIYDTRLVGRTSLFQLTDVATIPFLSKLYNMPKGLTVRHGASQAVAEFYGEFYSNSDMLHFMSLSGVTDAILPETNVKGDNLNNELNPGGEATLDVQYIMGMAPQAKTTFYSFSDRNPFTYENEGFLAFLYVIGGERSPPSVLSMSYGDVEGSVFNSSRRGAVEYGKRCDVEFMKLGLRGVSIIFSSGDDGVGNTVMRKDKALACSKTWPGWPASSPYVTSVGATQMTDKAIPLCDKLYASYVTGNTEMTQIIARCSEVGETSCSATNGCIITSGGGFSEVYRRDETAPWQMDFVKAYLSRHDYVFHAHRGGPDATELDGGDRRELKSNRPSTFKFDEAGRAFPDVSAYGSNFFVYLGGKIVRESGTSASAPVIAAMVTLWNDMRMSQGLPTMGFLNPTLYEVARSTPEAFNDITTGSNACGVGRSLETAPCCDHGFASTPGWDATTGLGTVNYGIFANLVINNQSFFPALGNCPGSIKDGKLIPTSSDFSYLNTASLLFSLIAIALYFQSYLWPLLTSKLFKTSVTGYAAGNNNNNNTYNHNHISLDRYSNEETMPLVDSHRNNGVTYQKR